MCCIKGTAPTSWRVVDSCSQPLGPNHGLCCWCRNWRLFFMVMLTSTRQTKWMIVICLLNTSAHNLLYGGGCSRSRVCACVCEGMSIVYILYTWFVRSKHSHWLTCGTYLQEGFLLNSRLSDGVVWMRSVCPAQC
jgi:hypothetical protein